MDTPTCRTVDYNCASFENQCQVNSIALYFSCGTYRNLYLLSMNPHYYYGTSYKFLDFHGLEYTIINATCRTVESIAQPKKHFPDGINMDKLEQICKTALEMFVVDGYNKTPLSKIASAVGLTKAGLYHYFKSKEELLFLIHEQDLKNTFIPKELIT